MTAVLPAAQRVAPGTQMRGRQVPSRQLSVDPHGTSVRPCPSALHRLRARLDAQVAAPGVHVHGVHAPVPARHAVIAGHAMGVYPRPSPLHCRRVFRPAHE